MKIFEALMFGAAVLALSHAPAAAHGSSGLHVDWNLLKPRDFAADYARGYEKGRRRARERPRAVTDGGEQAPRAPAPDLALRAERRRQADALIAAGHCDDARNDALVEGDLDQATRITKVCRHPVRYNCYLNSNDHDAYTYSAFVSAPAEQSCFAGWMSLREGALGGPQSVSIFGGNAAIAASPGR